MRIMQLIDTLEAGGAERMAVNIANENATRGIQSYLCTTGRSGPLEAFVKKDVRFLNLHKKRKVDLIAFQRFFIYIENQNIEIIHAHSTSIQLAVLTKIRFPKLKIVWHDHYGFSDRLKQRSSAKLKIFSSSIGVIIAVNTKLAQWAKEVLSHKKVYFLNNFSLATTGIEPYTYLKGMQGKRVLCLANLREQKNHNQLITAFVKSLQKHPDWTLHLIGKSFKDSYAQGIQDQIKELHVSDRVFLYGSRNDITHILSQATVGVLPSLSEGLPVALLEYGHAGLPVIVSEVGQCATVVGNNGIVIKDVQAEMADALTSMYRMPKDKRKSLGLSFRESVISNYSQEAFFEQLIPIYEGLLL